MNKVFKDDDPFYKECKFIFDQLITMALTGQSVGAMATWSDQLLKNLAEERKRNAELKGTEK